MTILETVFLCLILGSIVSLSIGILIHDIFFCKDIDQDLKVNCLNCINNRCILSENNRECRGHCFSDCFIIGIDMWDRGFYTEDDKHLNGDNCAHFKIL